MEVRRDLRLVLNVSAKGGSGTSTVTANLAWLLADRSGDEFVGVIDASFRGNHTVLKLLGINNPVAYGFWDVVLRNAEPTIIAGGKFLAVPPGTTSPTATAWEVESLVARHQGSPEAVANAILERVANLVTKLQSRGAGVVLVDAPGTTAGPVQWALLWLSRVINVVVRGGSTHMDEASELLRLVGEVVRERSEVGDEPVVNLVVNAEWPGQATASMLRGSGPFHHVFTLPLSLTVSYVTDVRRDVAVRYNSPEKAFREWVKAVSRLAEVSILGARHR